MSGAETKAQEPCAPGAKNAGGISPMYLTVNTQETTQEGNLLVFAGTIGGIPCRILVDSGATHNFIDEFLVQNTGMCMEPKPTPTAIRLANGQRQASTGTLPRAEVHIGSYTDALSFHITKLTAFEAIFGKE